jgi:hypothetical protein
VAHCGQSNRVLRHRTATRRAAAHCGGTADGFTVGGSALWQDGGRLHDGRQRELMASSMWVNEQSYTVTLISWASQPIRVRKHRRTPLTLLKKQSTVGACAAAAVSLLCPQPPASNPSPLPPSPIQEEDRSSPNHPVNRD